MSYTADEAAIASPSAVTTGATGAIGATGDTGITDAGRTLRGLAWALVSSISFGMSGTLAKGLMVTGWSPGATVTVRVAGAALVMLTPALILLRGRWWLLRRYAGLFLAYGVIAVAGTQLFYFISVQTLSVSVALLIEFLAPVLIVGWLWARHGQRPGPITALGVALSMLGLALVLDLFASRAGMRVDPVGMAWALGAAVCVSVYFVLSARPTPELPPFVLVAGGMVVGATALILAGLTGLTRWTWSNAPVELGGAVVAPWVPLAGLVLVTAVLAYATGLMGARALGPRVASFVSLTEVLAATIFAWLLLGELPRVVQLVGGVAIVLGACAVKIGEVRELRSAASAASGTSAGAAGAGGSAADSGR